MKYAETIQDENVCIMELLNPIPDAKNTSCVETYWPHFVEEFFNVYRGLVFFWILFGLIWLGGVVKMLWYVSKYKKTLR